jgi:hypothetical protein
VNVGWVVTVEVGVKVLVEIAVSVAVVAIEVVGVTLAPTSLAWRTNDTLAVLAYPTQSGRKAVATIFTN